MEKIIKNEKYLNILKDCNNCMRKSIINGGNKDLIHTICECVLNCVNGNVKLSNPDKAVLSKHKRKLRKLLKSKNSSLKRKKAILIQSGGSFLPIILSTILSSLLG